MADVVWYALACGLALSALLVPVTALAMRHATELRAESRHLIWFMVLFATVAATVTAFAVSALRPAQPFAGAVVSAAVPAPAAHAAAVPPGALCAVLLACWLAGAVANMVFLVRRIVRLRAMKRRATPIDVDCELPRGARALAPNSGMVAAVGFLHPAILLPPEAMATLAPADARRVVLHEAAHLRRGDDLTGLAFQLCAAAFWFNPFVHYIGKKLSLECEIACDETVVAQTGDAARYATLLFEMAETMTERGPQLAWNGFAHRSGFVMRMQHLLAGRPARALPRPALAAVIAVLLSGVGLAVFNAPALARAQDDATTRVRQAAQHVRAFPACKVYRSPGARNSSMPCDAEALQVTPSYVKFTESNMHVTPAEARSTHVMTRIEKQGATP